jgi:hypothetical protein
MHATTRPFLAAGLAATLAVAAALPAAAQDRPANLLPTRDVALTYRILGVQAQPGHGAPTIGIAYLAAEGKMRVEMGAVIPGMNAWGLTDMRSGRSDVVLENLRTVIPNPGGQDLSRALRMAEGARMTRGDAATVAGQRCTNWRWENEGQRGTSCLTADGVMLRAVNEAGQGMEATEVGYAAQDAARFRVPAGYRQQSLEDAARSMAQPPPQRR